MGVVVLISIQRLTGDNKMKVLAVLLLCGLCAAWEDPAQSQQEMYRSWVGMKAMESCWGEENIKTQTINLKLAVAQCSQQDAPELNLPPFRSPYKFINTLLTSADEKEQQQIVFIHKMLQEMNGNSHGQYNNNNNGFSNSNSWSNNVFKKMMMMKLMNKYMSGNHHDSINYGNMFADVDQFNYNDFMDHSDEYSNYNVEKMVDMLFEDKMKENMMKYKMQQMHGSDVDKFRSINPFAKNSYRQKMSALLQRHKRQAKPAGGAAITLPESLDLGDKLADKLKQEQEMIKSSVGNMTCVMKKMGVINDQNELDINTQKRALKKLNFDSKWLHDRIEDDMEMCVNMANALPNEVQHRFHYPGMVNLSKLKAYKKCCLETRLRTCAFYDVKKTLESNYGSMDSILEQTKLTENQLLPLMMNLLHGDEIKYYQF